jgi:filamentous hemagglutinin family protein
MPVNGKLSLSDRTGAREGGMKRKSQTLVDSLLDGRSLKEKFGGSECSRIYLVSLIVGFSTLFLLPAQSQIIPDETLAEERSQVRPATIRGVESDRIEGGARRGEHLFHSFERFNIGAGRGAYFNNPAGIENIFGRVTGNLPSDIQGALGVIREGTTDTLGTANLFLMNPNGIVFGQGARLDLGGSFVGTTADAIGFGDRGVFSATLPDVPSQVLMVNPSAFLFSQFPTGNIVSTSTAPSEPGSDFLGLRVLNSKSLVLLGGNVSIDGGGGTQRAGLHAFGGRVRIGAVGGVGTIGLNPDDSLDFPDGIERAEVSFANRSIVDVSLDGGGDIEVTAQNINILSDSVLKAGIDFAGGNAQSQAGDLILDATGMIRVEQSSQIENDVNFGFVGNSGNLNITADSLWVTGGSQLSASTRGQGNAGNVIINARDRISFDGISTDGEFVSAADARVESDAVGQGGNVQLTTGLLFLSNGAGLAAATRGQGNAGNVIINARDRISFDNATAFSTVELGGVGQGGNIQITAGSLTLVNGAQLLASTRGQGDAGNVTVNARDQIIIDGTDGQLPSVVSSNVGSHAKGQGGNVHLTTDSLTLSNDAQLESLTRGQGNAGNVIIDVRDQTTLDSAFIVSNVASGGTGQGGDVQITTGSLSLVNGAQLQVLTRGQGDAGNIIIDAHDRVSFDGTIVDGQFPSAAFSTVASGGMGRGGNVQITTGSLFLTNGAGLTASTGGQGDAGNVIVNARDRVSFSGTSADGQFPSGAGSSVESYNAVGRGGNVQITTGFLSLIDGAKLITSTSGQGNAGDITINAYVRVTLDNAKISGDVESDGVGQGGNVEVTTDSLSLSNGAQLTTSTFGTGNAGNVTVNARDRISFNGTSADGQFPSGAFSTVESGAMGNGGSISIHVGSLSLLNGARLSTSTLGQGDAGDINIAAGGDIKLRGEARGSNRFASYIYSLTDAGGRGDAGDINIRARALALSDGAQIGAGPVRPRRDQQGNYLPGGQGRGGNIQLDITDLIRLSNIDSRGFPSGILVQTDRGTVGRAGTIIIRTGDLRIEKGAIVSASTSNEDLGGNIFIDADNFEAINGGQIVTSARSSGDAGRIILNVSENTTVAGIDPNFRNRQNRVQAYLQSLREQSERPSDVIINQGSASGLFANTSARSSGNGGSININTQNLAMTDRARISAQSQGRGIAGNIIINTNDTLNLNNSRIETTAIRSNGGDIRVNAPSGVVILENGDITTNSQRNGGNITVQGNIVAFDDSDIVTRSEDQIGGDITLGALFSDPPAQQSQRPNNDDGRVDLDAEGNLASGNVTTPDTSFIQNSLTNIPEAPLDTDRLLANSCLNRTPQTGRFTVTGTDGLPQRPGNATQSDYPTGTVQSIPEAETRSNRPWQMGDAIVEPQGVHRLPDGRLAMGSNCDAPE